MPNWCANDAQFYNEDKEQVDAFEKILKELSNEKEEGLFNYFLPRPETEADWYSWNVQNWGTKWDVNYVNFDRVDDNTIALTFDTAWGPPVALYEHLTLNTDWYVTAKYFEPGMCFVGCYDGDGEETYKYSDLNSLDDVPEELIEHYGIRDMLMDFDEAELDELIEEFNDMTLEQNEIQVNSTTSHPFDNEAGRDWMRGVLKMHVCEVVFTKKDGTERTMRCTLNPELIPSADSDTSSSGNRKKSDEAQAVYDLDADGWRSFRWDSVISIQFSLGA
jgi:hypothetical protein